MNATLTGTTPDQVTITGYNRVEVINRGSSGWLWVDPTGTAESPAAADDGLVPVGPMGVYTFDPGGDGIQVLGNGNDYSVVGVA